MITREELLEKVNETRKEEFKARVDDLNALKQEFGEKVVEIVARERGKKVEENWRRIAEEHGRNDIEGIKQTLWRWVAEAGFEFTEIETDEVGTQLHVTKCPLADMARELEAADWGFTCYCADDPHITAGFNPEIGFRRTKTLMEGDQYCDHFYFMKENSGNPEK
ncbi:MAG: L-2-amino-thiazoline-4-carboxylic acid hydrolase [Anaerolineales bacterium]|nr:L-2-amino-thiazoline-4-carboxylic acid hydrolase [Anaerolineales bacterium]